MRKKEFNFNQTANPTINKSNLNMMIFISIFLYILCSLSSFKMTNEIIDFFIIIVPIIILLLFLFTKTIFKDLDNRVLNKYYGQLGLFNSLVFAILFSNNMSEIAMKKFLYFVIIFVFSVIFIIVMEIVYRKFNFDIKPQIVKPTFIAPFSAFGVFVGDFFKEKDVEILIKYAPLLFGAVFLMFYPYLIKYKKQSGETNQTNY